VLARLAEILHFAGDEPQSLVHALEAVRLAGELGDEQVMADALAGRHVSLLHAAHLRERLAVSDALIRLGRTMRDRERTLQGLHARIYDLIQAGEIAAARDALAELAALADETRQPLFAHFAVGWSGALAQMEGRLEDAERLAAESYEMRRRMETADAENVFAAQLFLIRMGQGRLAELVPAVEQLVEEYPALAVWRAGLPMALNAAGRHDDAARELEQMVARLDAVPRDFFWLSAMAVLSEASGKLRHRASAEVLYETLAPYADRVVLVGYAGGFGPVARMLGLLAEARGDRDAAVAHLEAAVAQAESGGLGLFETQAREELEELLTRSA
jgi:tetratricopeptide (TPR) repeat protein